MRGSSSLDSYSGDPSRLSNPSPEVEELFSRMQDRDRNGCRFKCLAARECLFLSPTTEEMCAHVLLAHDPPPRADCPYCHPPVEFKSKLNVSRFTRMEKNNNLK